MSRIGGVSVPSHSHARVTVHPAFVIADIAAELFGAFVEHLGRGVYGGIYQPTHPTADVDGFRTDVLKLTEELGVTTVRYPGGNFVSGYDWRDGIGPVPSRPARLDPAWHSVESNAFGTDEFVRWARAAQVEPMLAVNLGTGDIRSALQLLEYANHPAGTTLSDERCANGAVEPHNIRFWCLGNEMDGPWQIGRKTAGDYGKLAAATGAAMRAIDPTVKLVVCGSSNDRMATFGTWEREVLSETIEIADYISCHQYFRNEGNLPEFLASGVAMDRFIDSVAATITHVKAASRSHRNIAISFDEWNVWDWTAHDAVAPGLTWERAPALLEQQYTVADAVVVGDMLISFFNHADIVRAASLAQLVNVIAPIMTEPDGSAWRQTIFYPFADARRSAGMIALRTVVDCDQVPTTLPAPAISAAAAHSPHNDELHLYLVNRSVDHAVETHADLSAFGNLTLKSSTSLSESDPYVCNNAGDPNRVSPQSLDAQLVDSELQVSLPPVSWSVLRFLRPGGRD